MIRELRERPDKFEMGYGPRKAKRTVKAGGGRSIIIEGPLHPAPWKPKGKMKGTLGQGGGGARGEGEAKDDGEAEAVPEAEGEPEPEGEGAAEEAGAEAEGGQEHEQEQEQMSEEQATAMGVEALRQLGGHGTGPAPLTDADMGGILPLMAGQEGSGAMANARAAVGDVSPRRR